MTVIDLSTSKVATRRRAAAASAPTGAAPRDVLVIVHRSESNPGRVGQWLRANGYRLDICCPREGGSMPETLENHAGVVMFGGPMSANDPDDYIKQEIDWLAVPLREEKPYFGICLGAQMLAKQLGVASASIPRARSRSATIRSTHRGGTRPSCLAGSRLSLALRGL